MKTLVRILFVCMTCFLIVDSAWAQHTAKQAKAAAQAAAVKSKIESGTYTFKADYAQPMRGGNGI